MVKHHILIILIALSICSFNAAASVTLTNGRWDSTFNCPDWTYPPDSPVLGCDGLERSLDGASGYVTRVEAGANNPTGAGGKGLSWQVGNGNGQSTSPSSSNINIGWSGSNNFWLRWYVSLPAGMPIQSCTIYMWKQLYAYDSSMANSFYIDTENYDHLSLYDRSSRNTGSYGFDDFYGSASDGSWMAIEMHFDIPNKVWEYWVYKNNVDDAVAKYRSTNVQYPMSSIAVIKFPENVKSSCITGAPVTFRFDDLAISTVGRIGPVNSAQQQDTSPPSVVINSPTSSSTYSTGSAALSLGGTASDNVGLTQISWSNSAGGSGTATGTSSWTVGSIELQSGTNMITVTARDASGNTGTDTITVTYTPASAVCGNGITESGEQCDDSNTVTESCAYGLQSCSVCSSSCQTVAGQVSYCGDSACKSGESCSSCSEDCQCPSGNLASECSSWNNDWIFCDDFSSTDPLVGSGRYFESDTNNGEFGVYNAVGMEGSRGIRAHYQQGEVEAGSLHLGFGRLPNSYMRKNIRPNEDFREIYYRFYMKNDPAWQGNPAKLSRATVFSSSTDFSQAMIAHFWADTNYRVLMDPVRCVSGSSVVCQGYNDFSHMTWLGQGPGITPIWNGNYNDRWLCIEQHVKLNDPGQSNGIQEFWIDGNLEARKDNLNLLGSYSSYGINSVYLETYWNSGSVKDQYRFYDNLIVSTKPIGCGESCNKIHAADNSPCDSIVSISELFSFISLWRSGASTLSEMMDAIRHWKQGS